MTEQLPDLTAASAEGIFAEAGFPAQYKVRSVLGQGGMGIVFRAFDQTLQRDVAIKVSLANGDEASRERFLREARVLARIDHPNIVKILNSGINQSGAPYYVMELLEGETLAEKLGKEKHLSLEKFQRIFASVLAGLDSAHQQGIVHRDLKPSNIFLLHQANDEGVKVIDFGIARLEQAADGDLAGRTITKTNEVLGSPYYMSPEQCRGQRGDSLSDIYSVACIMYQALEGKVPFKGETAFDTMAKHLNDPLPELKSLKHVRGAASLEAVIRRCLEKDPAKRFSSASELSAALSNIFSGGIKTQRKSKVSFIVSTSVIVAVVVAAIGALLLTKPSATDSDLHKQSAEPSRARELNAVTRKLSSRLSRLEASLKTESSNDKRTDDIISIQDTAAKLADAELELTNYLPDSEAKQSLLQADKLLSRGLAYDIELSGKNVLLLSERARCRLALNRIKDARTDIDQAFQLAEQIWGQASGQWVDVYLQRLQLLIACKDYAETSLRLNNLKTMWTGKLNPGDGALHRTQFLNMDGPTRAMLLYTAFQQLEKTRSNTDAERKQQIAVALQFSQLFMQIHEKKSALEAIKLASTLEAAMAESADKATVHGLIMQTQH